MRRANALIIIGVTGNIGCGKTTVAKLFGRRGIRIIDADSIAHRLLNKRSVSGKIIRVFGKSILDKDRSINRKKLAELAFSDRKSWRLLCNIVHPEVKTIIGARLRRARKDKAKATVIDAPLLIEAGLEKIVDYVVVVSAGLEQQIRRVKRGLGLGPHDFRDRLRFQMPLEKKIKKADFIIDNSKTFKFTERQVNELWKRIAGN